MKFVRIAFLATLAGSAVSVAQPTLDGKLVGDAAYYGAAKFTQNQPTSFCNNTNVGCIPVGGGVRFAIDNSNAAGVPGGGGTFLTPVEQAACAAVSTGLEIAIPVSQLGTLGSSVRITGWINGGGSDYLSNQVIGGFTGDQGNLGGDGNGNYNGLVAIDWTSKAGDQFVSVTVPGTIAATNVSIDGSRDLAYPAPQFVQTNQTQFGDGTAGAVDCPGGGSEIANVSAFFGNADFGSGAANYLFVFVAGNLECNFNRLNLVIDNGSGSGFNVIPASCLPASDGLDKHIGMKFDAGFSASHYLSFRNGGGPFGIYSDFAQIQPSGSGGYIGGGGPAATAIVGSNTSCPPSETASTGSELDQVFAKVDRVNGRLNLLVTGNLKENVHLHLFFDAAAGGQSPMNNLNHTIGIADGGNGHLNRFGPVLMGDPSLTFDSNFSPDYWLTSHFENGNRQVIDASILRVGGKDLIPMSSASLDFGSYQGKDSGTEINFDGTNFDGNTNPPAGIQLQDGSAPNPLSSYSPRESRRVFENFINGRGGYVPLPDNTEWTNYVLANPPVAGKIRARFSNLNVGGVTDSSAASASTADAGFEYSIALSEIGYTSGPIKVAGFISDSGSTRVSNQVIGGSGSLTNLGDPRNINFSNIAGNQYAVVFCPQDFNQDGSVSVQDIFDFLAAWFGNAPGSDFNGVGGTGVQDIFDFLAAWFGGPCV